MESLGAFGRLGLDGLLLFVYPNFILQWIILPLGGWQRGFSPSSSVSSSITRGSVIFVFASLFSTLFLLIAIVFAINYGLECFTNLGIALYLSFRTYIV